MTQEEKAKAYDEAIEKLRDFYRDYDTVSCLIDVISFLVFSSSLSLSSGKRFASSSFIYPMLPQISHWEGKWNWQIFFLFLIPLK